MSVTFIQVKSVESCRGIPNAGDLAHSDEPRLGLDRQFRNVHMVSCLVYHNIIPIRDSLTDLTMVSKMFAKF